MNTYISHFAFTSKIIRTLNITAHHPSSGMRPDDNINQRDFKCFQHNLTGIINIKPSPNPPTCRLHSVALLPSAAFAAPATEETVIVEGSATAPDDGENELQRNVYLCGYQNADDST